MNVANLRRLDRYNKIFLALLYTDQSDAIWVGQAS